MYNDLIEMLIKQCLIVMCTFVSQYFISIKTFSNLERKNKIHKNTLQTRFYNNCLVFHNIIIID